MLGKEPIFTIHAELEAITSLGQTPYGERRVIGILGGVESFGLLGLLLGPALLAVLIALWREIAAPELVPAVVDEPAHPD